MALLRNFVFTVNNYSLEDCLSLEELANNGPMSFLVYGHEIGKNGTPHLQGYAELTKRTRFRTVKAMPGLTTAHIENRRGTAQQAADYCKKDGEYVETGTMSKQGARPDLDHIRDTATSEGMRMVTNIGNLQQIRTAEKFLEYNEEQRNFMPEVLWFHGSTGTGKSKTAREICGDDTYTKNSDTKWWTGYDAHTDVIIDDFRPSWWSLTYMLGLLDRYPFQIETKGGQRQMLAKRIIVTSALHPSQCYLGTGEAIGQLLRRISQIREFVPDVVPKVEGVILAPSNFNEKDEDILEI